MKDKKRTLVLLGVLLALATYAVPNVIMNNDSSSVSNSKTNKVASNTNTNKDKDKDKDSIIKNGNTVNASKSSKSINKDKLEIDSLMSNSYTLKTADSNNNPFKSPVSSNNKDTKKENININQPQNLPKTIGINNNDVMGNNFTAVPSTQVQENIPQKKETQMTLRAIAQTNNNIIAVIEAGGKKTSAFIGTAIADYTVTDIDSEHVYLQDDDGNTRVLDLSK